MKKILQQGKIRHCTVYIHSLFRFTVFTEHFRTENLQLQLLWATIKAYLLMFTTDLKYPPNSKATVCKIKLM